MEDDARALMEPREAEVGQPARRGRPLLRALGALGLLAVGALAGAAWSERRWPLAAMLTTGAAAPGQTSGTRPGLETRTPGGPEPATRGTPDGARAAPASPGEAATAAPAGDDAVEVALTPEAVERAGIRTAAARAETATETLTVPGTIVSNAYRETRVNALVGGIVRQVPVELGTPVRQGQALALVFSTELADAQTRYLATRALLHADEQRRRRAEALVAIGAASRQELEEVTAVHASHETELAALRQRLLWLGLADDEVERLASPAQIVAEVTVAAPAGGVVLTRGVNPGQVVAAGQELFVVADLTTVWAIGDLYEKDAGAVRVGGEARVSLPSPPATPLRGRVAYIDPRVDPATRTAKVRVEVPNPDGALRLGMYVTLTFRAGPGRRSVVVPRSAVQAVGGRWVVYVPVAGDEARFVERRVRLGAVAGDRAEVLAGLQPGERVVTEGSFHLRAEAARTR
jgi:RND family efflux transporter MFP subunit